MALEIRNFTPVRLLSMNVRTENHGDGLSRAIDLKCQVKLPNTQLLQVDPPLLAMLYKAAESEEEKAAQGELPSVDPATALPLLRSHQIRMPMSLAPEYSGYQLTIDRGLGGSSNLVLSEVSLNKLTADCEEGGTVLFGFRMQVSNVGDDVIGRISSYIKSDMHIALSPPSMKQEAIDGTTDATGDKVLDAGAKSAEKPKTSSKPAAKKGKSAPSSDEIAKAFAEAEAKGLNKPADQVPAPPKKRTGKPSLKVPSETM